MAIQNKNHDFKVYLGRTKDSLSMKVYLKGFKWDCEWYWSGGYVESYQMHTHFDCCFLNIPDFRGHPLGCFTPQNISNGCAVWEDISTFLDDAQFTTKDWWRIKDLYKQFYSLKDAAETFQYGGNCTAYRNPSEINKDMADKINEHIELVIIPEIKKALKVEV
jgi:hypothetical protein